MAAADLVAAAGLSRRPAGTTRFRHSITVKLVVPPPLSALQASSCGCCSAFACSPANQAPSPPRSLHPCPPCRRVPAAVAPPARAGALHPSRQVRDCDRWVTVLHIIPVSGWCLVGWRPSASTHPWLVSGGLAAMCGAPADECTHATGGHTLRRCLGCVDRGASVQRASVGPDLTACQDTVNPSSLRQPCVTPLPPARQACAA